MFRLDLRRVLCWLAAMSVVAAAPAEDFSASYELGPGDLIAIQVFDEPELSVESHIGDRGNISYPFLGELQVKGLTAPGLERLITKRLKGPYLVNPVVTVSIREYRPFFVNGEVAKPGGFPFSPGLTVRKAISLAGGFEERANKGRINVVRETDPGRAPRAIGLDDGVLPGDIITVERSFF